MASTIHESLLSGTHVNTDTNYANCSKIHVSVADTEIQCLLGSSILGSGSGRGGIGSKHSTEVESMTRIRTSVGAFTLEVSRAPISVECLFSMALLPGKNYDVLMKLPDGRD